MDKVENTGLIHHFDVVNLTRHSFCCTLHVVSR
jgi:hypothetical protein